MAKKKELYTLSKDGEVISGVEIKTKVKNKVLLDLGEGEGLLVKDKIDVFKTEQEAINEMNNQGFDFVNGEIEWVYELFDAFSDRISDIEKEINHIKTIQSVNYDETNYKIKELKSRKWWQ